MAKERYSKADPEFQQQDHDYFRLYRSLLFPHVIGPRVFDVGCGEGWLTADIAKLDHVEEIFAMDRYEGPRQEHAKIRYVHGNIPGDLEPRSADTVVSTEFVEHITEDDFGALCVKIQQMLVEPWAYFIGSTPNRMVPRTNPFHLREYTIDELSSFFRRAGFTKRYIWHVRDLTVFKVK